MAVCMVMVTVMWEEGEMRMRMEREQVRRKEEEREACPLVRATLRYIHRVREQRESG